MNAIELLILVQILYLRRLEIHYVCTKVGTQDLVTDIHEV